MAKATLNRAPQFVTQLEAALRRELRGADVSKEHIRDQRYRFIVIWDGFSGIGHPQRQRRVWDLAEKVVKKSDLFDVGMIITMAPEELPKD